MTKRTEIMKERVAAMESVNASFRPLYDALSLTRSGLRTFMPRKWTWRAMGHKDT